jgi:hypothetical protein
MPSAQLRTDGSELISLCDAPFLAGAFGVISAMTESSQMQLFFVQVLLPPPHRD